MTSETADNILQLPAVADLTFAATLKDMSERALSAGTGLVVDASGVQRISSPCLQILASAATAFTKAGGPVLVFSDPSTDFLETVSMLGLDSALGLTRA